MPRVSVSQICVRCLALLEEPPCGRPDVLAAVGVGLELAYEGFECGDVAPGARAHGAGEEDAVGGQTEAALALFRCRAPGKDAHPTQAVLRKIPGTKRLDESKTRSGTVTYTMSCSTRCSPLGSALNSTPSRFKSVRAS